ncbi:carotenoid oxygenase family protein [Gloeothece verrucosa]|uniref:9-cis-epoxycarotenoid dioxygenase n=1 Tax=Gloeothece verrucosa (strain PCC 7822) TaxID=497965 RepID=E0UFG4_GLOV7|nr:carotenoid oxygenase family protein [Gloeothece verrucosa]ADN16658.1 9-cis-epoxycarotenoid dioxygenase [Gloeothece verrucosa PCC 7822]
MVEPTAIAEISPFLAGNFAPVHQEITSTNLKVIGKIPPELRGSFVRNGPNPQFDPLGMYHWFDGDGMLHGVEIKDSQATYRNRYVKTAGFMKEHQAGKALYGGILGPRDLEPELSFKNVSNTALVWHHQQLLSLWEGGEPYLIDVPSLDTVGSQTFEGKLNTPFTAHPKVDPVTGEMMFIGYNMITPPFLHYGIVSADGKLSKLVPIELPVGVMMHDFAITEHYSIFPNLPLTFRPEKMAKGEAAFQFESHTPSYFGILPRHGEPDSIRWFETNSCFIYHTLNAYEEGDEVILLACRMEATSVLGMVNDPEMANKNDIPFLTRWRFNLRDNSVKEEILDDVPSEFPTLNPAYVGRKNRYGYSMTIKPDELPLWDGIIKYDLETGNSWRYQYGLGRYGGEAVFAPNPLGSSEDDGWLITFVYDQSTDSSELVILAAQNLEYEPVARVLIPQRVPYGFHGLWVPQS